MEIIEFSDHFEINSEQLIIEDGYESAIFAIVPKTATTQKSENEERERAQRISSMDEMWIMVKCSECASILGAYYRKADSQITINAIPCQHCINEGMAIAGFSPYKPEESRAGSSPAPGAR